MRNRIKKVHIRHADLAKHGIIAPACANKTPNGGTIITTENPTEVTCERCRRVLGPGLIDDLKRYEATHPESSYVMEEDDPLVQNRRKDSPMMECGHAANAEDSKGNPCCAVCVGIHPGAEKVAKNPPDLTGRMAKCTYCSATVPSSPKLPFFEYCPQIERDSYYCGCRGWD